MDNSDGVLRVDPPGMTGWTGEEDLGRPLLLLGPGEVRVKLVATARGVSAFVLAGEAEQAREILLRLGFAPERVRRMLCG
jgi:hypothetical protein